MSHRLPCGQFWGTTARRHELAGLVLTETRYAPGARVPPHSHENAYVCLVRRGGYRESFGWHWRDCGPRSVAVHPAGELHSEQFLNCEVSSFNVEVPPEWVRRLNGRAAVLGEPFAVRGGPAADVALRLYREFAAPDAATPLAVEGLALELLAELSRHTGPAVGRARPAWLTRVRDRLQDGFASPPSLAELAAEAGVHPVHLAAAFRRHFRASVGEFVRRRRVEVACDRLAATDAPLAVVALDAGFADQSHFTRQFKRLVGLTPAQYRRATRST
jgi:AraC family transcriptional regulator